MQQKNSDNAEVCFEFPILGNLMFKSKNKKMFK